MLYGCTTNDADHSFDTACDAYFAPCHPDKLSDRRVREKELESLWSLLAKRRPMRAMGNSLKLIRRDPVWKPPRMCWMNIHRLTGQDAVACGSHRCKLEEALPANRRDMVEAGVKPNRRRRFDSGWM